MSDVPRLVVGLGNPGKDYAGTRHNVGFEVLGGLAAAAGLVFQREKKWQAEVCRTAEGLLLLKPQTYMNLSGRAVAAAARFYKIPPEEILVVYDDVALPLGQQRFRMSGGSGGHNGIESLITDLGSKNFPRLKIGIGGAPGARLTGHVLGRFREEERDVAEKALASAVDAVQVALAEGVSKAANRFNVRPKAPKTKPDPESQPKRPEDEQEIRRPDCSEHEGEGR
ncbi:MAG: aminoacyl-tRNA hydrolase [Verrucomicrobiota bacterium]|nr:aminoacyl-tRNA hydrolase [Verrucomicrobiota bacterium]